MISGPYQVTEEDVSRSSTLETSDIGRWYLFLTGCYVFYDSEDDAREDKAVMDAMNSARAQTYTME